MFQAAPALHPSRERRFRQYAGFLRSVGADDNSYVVAPAGRSQPDAQVRVTYGPGLYENGDLLAETRVATTGGDLLFTSGLDQALYHLSWFFADDRAAAMADAVAADDLPAAMAALRLGRDDVRIDGGRSETGYVMERQGEFTRLVLIETYGDVVPIATSRSAPTLAYVVRFLQDLETGDVVERTAAFLPPD